MRLSIASITTNHGIILIFRAPLFAIVGCVEE
jgi:hypothetical protein